MLHCHQHFCSHSTGIQIAYCLLPIANSVRLINIGMGYTMNLSYTANGKKIKTISNGIIRQYIDGIEYENGILQFISTEEGRVRPLQPNCDWPDAFVYDYFLKDHINNVRAVITTEICNADYLATMELQRQGIEDSTFQKIEETRAPKPPDAPNDTTYIQDEKVSKLNATNGHTIGHAKVLSMMQGDRVDFMAKYFFDTQNFTFNTNPATAILNQLANIFFLNNPSNQDPFEVRQALAQATFTNNATLQNFLQNNLPTTGDGSSPQAFLVYLFLDKNFKLVPGNSGILQATTPDILGNLSISNMTAAENGYMYIYVNNNTPQDVSFDNLRINHFNGLLLEENHYYPYGMLIPELSNKNLNSPKNKYLHSSQELIDQAGINQYQYLARTYDPATTRWQHVDPLAHKYPSISPYAYCLNNPINAIDPDGRDVILLIWASHDGKIGHAGIAVSNYKTEYYKVKENGKMVTKSRQVEDGTYTYRDLWPGGDGAGKKNFDKDVPASYNKGVFTLDQLKNTDVTGSEGYAADGVIQLNTDEMTDFIVNTGLEAHQKYNTSYNGLTNNCSDLCEVGVEYAAGKQLPVDEKLTGKVSATTPNQLYKATKTLPNATVIKDAGTKVNQGFIEAVSNGKEDKARKKID